MRYKISSGLKISVKWSNLVTGVKLSIIEGD